MYAYSSFPSRFAVFRGPYHSTLRTELVDSIMIFESTPSADDSFYTATTRLWQGTIVGDDNMPDTTVRQVKIHSPLRANYHGIPFSPSNERFVMLPFRTESRIPILAFESNNWMPRFEQVIHLTHKIHGESFKYHYQNIHYVAGTLMRQQEPLPSYISWLQSLADPYAEMNRAEICTIPYPHISPMGVHTIRRNIIEDYHRRNMAAREVLDMAVATVPATQPPVPTEDEDYSSMFDAAAGWVASDEEEEEVVPPAVAFTIPTFILENHLAHEVQKGTECPITLTRLTTLKEVAVSPNCGHIFEQEALKAWGNVQQSAGVEIACPVCRKAFSGVLVIKNKAYIPISA